MNIKKFACYYHHNVKPNRTDIEKIILFMAICGSFLEICGGVWDSLSHILHEPEYFWTIQHLVIYFGIIMTSTTAVISMIILLKNKTNIKFGLLMIVIGSTLQLLAGYADSISHEVFGLDGLISLPHQILESGLVIATFGSLIISIKISPHTKHMIIIFPMFLFFSSICWLFFNFSLLIFSTVACVPIYQVFNSGCIIF
ncbi:MAG: hypothetical protein OXF28_01620 [Thaumarchaeota archaeon]|nr:hypothetical protein [Nitrososphaerota archaeon]MCY3975818.1 hypothetical protein [Nitrososphaerota archaeon]